MKTEKIEELLDGFDRVVKEFNLEDYHDEWLVELVDRTRFTARTTLAALKEWGTKAREALKGGEKLMASARAEFTTLKEENERLRRGLVCPVCGGRDFHNTNTGLGLEHKDGRLFCSSECLVRAIRDEHEAALSQELAIKEDKILQCPRRAVELVYGGKCNHMSGAEIRQMLVDEFGEETVAALDEEERE